MCFTPRIHTRNAAPAAAAAAAAVQMVAALPRVAVVGGGGPLGILLFGMLQREAQDRRAEHRLGEPLAVCGSTDGAKRLSDNAVARYNASVEAIDALIKDPRGALRAQYVGGDQNGFYRVTREAVDLVDATRRKYGLPSLADSYIRAGAKGIRHGSGVV